MVYTLCNGKRTKQGNLLEIFISPPPSRSMNGASWKAGLFGHCTPWSFADVAPSFRGRNQIFRKTTGVHQISKKNMDYSPTLLNAMLTIKGRNIFWFFILKMKEDSIFFNMFGKIVVNHPTRACLLLTPHLLKMCFSQRKKVQWKYWLPEKRRSVPCPYISWIYNKGTLDFLCAQMKRQAIGILKPLQNDAFFLRTVKLILCLLSSSLLLS